MPSHRNINKCKYIEIKIDDTEAIIMITTQTNKQHGMITTQKNKQTDRKTNKQKKKNMYSCNSKQ